MVYPPNFESKIGFEKIRKMLKNLCIGELGRKTVENLQFSKSFDHVKTSISQVEEFVKIIENESNFPINHYIDITPFLKKIYIEGAYFEIYELFDFKRSLETGFSLARFFENKSEEDFPTLKKLFQNISLPRFVLDKINKTINKHGKIRDNASPSLQNIRNELFQKQSGVSKRMSHILKNIQNEGLVDRDVSVTIRNGRMVIPINASNKKRIKGFVHDESATGKTAFVEPMEIFDTNNEIRELEYSEKREILKILIGFANFVRPYLNELFEIYQLLGTIDFIRAKALFAIQIKGVKPKLQKTQELEFHQAIHPLLFISHRAEGKKVVPLDVKINKNQRIILISGPNAGGKSVCLKTVGLLQYMLQCGLLIPVNEESTIGIFSRIFIDIGDEQSIENDLSTYSSHLLNMKFFLKNADSESLILIDEFGTGTEPMLGAAIAESILDELNSLKIKGVITTHYTSLKQFAANNEGIENGAMLFDNHKMQAFYKLEIGKPGSSFAFEIAKKIGLPENILKLASEKVGKDQTNFDKLLREVVRDKRYWENKRKKIRQSEKKLDELIENYTNDIKVTEKQRKKIIREADEEAKKLINGANKQIENTIREIKETQADKEKTKIARLELEKYKIELEKKEKVNEKSNEEKIKKIERKEKQIRHQYPGLKTSKITEEKLQKNIDNTIRIGDKVRLKEQDIVGELVEMNEKKWIIAFGNLMTTIEKDQVEKISFKEFAKHNRTPKSSKLSVGWDKHDKMLNFKHNIDIRGKRVYEALSAIKEYIDEAIVLNITEAKILHGTGNGILRQYIRDYIQTVENIEWFGDEMVEFGGSGITVIRFKK
ncbi:MAG: endonuclease MutS2 [Bacteroidetes bacterium]|jgi:DNA mismatch repair protein MutS2|nr:endonuclease MutS2 [Bacteroidota bacterium]MBT7142975.1 endonuclease MutS2 [Bacteroidota bacterium]MBT7491726.1 endonuclease MutS2 [Bacteroidota bacterium]